MTDKEWLASLKVGDKVAVSEWVPGARHKYEIHTIERITPTKQIQVSNISQKFRDGNIPSDRYNNGKELCPLTPEIEEKVLRRDTIELMRNIKEGQLSQDQLKRIKAIIEE